MSSDDQRLIEECLAGRTEAFGELVVRYQDRLFNALVGMLRSREEARDVAQDAFVQAYQKLSSFRGQAAFYSWLFRIALNAAVSRKRRDKHISGSVDAARERTGIEPADLNPAAEPSHAMQSVEMQAAVQKALGELSDEFRTILVLKEIDDLKYEQIAEILQIPIGTVRSRIHRARAEMRAKLRQILQEE